MKKEWISAFVDGELAARELELLRNGNRQKLRELANVYRVIGESIRKSQPPLLSGGQFQERLIRVIQQEYAGFADKRIKEESVI